jgi:hypothetical protein
MPAVAIRGQAAAAPVEGIVKVLLGFVERLDDLRWSLPSPRLIRSSLPPRGFSGVQIEPKMVQNPDFPVVLGCAERQSRRTAKSGIKKNQWVRISMRDARALPQRRSLAARKPKPGSRSLWTGENIEVPLVASAVIRLPTSMFRCVITPSNVATTCWYVFGCDDTTIAASFGYRRWSLLELKLHRSDCRQFRGNRIRPDRSFGRIGD